jgi:uncharacterized protein (DUF1697 family)
VAVYIVLFRGVGGATQLPVARLREVLTSAGFEKVATYINSGNAVVKSQSGAGKVVASIADICRHQFGFTKDIYALTANQWSSIIRNNPFPDAVSPGNLLHAAVLAKAPARDAVAKLDALAIDGDRFAVVGRAAYLHTPNGFSKSKLSEKFDKVIGVPNTARNWNTVLKLRDLAAYAGG